MEPPDTFDDGLIRQDVLQQLQDGPSDAVKDCAESVKEDNPDLTKSQAFAICQDMENKGELREASHAVTIHRGLQTFNGQSVRRIENDDGGVTYQNLAILAPGEWTDAASGETIFYSPEAIQTLAAEPGDHVTDASVNVNHEHDDQLKQVGSFDPDTLETDENGVLYADVTLHGRTQASQDTIELVDLALETDGEQGAGGPSVEIPQEGEVTEFDKERGMQRMVEFNLSGLSIVTHSASMDVGFEEQFAERPVAMSGDAGGVRVLQAGESTLPTGRHDSGMGDDDEPDDPQTEEIELSADALPAAHGAADGELTVLAADDNTVTIEVEADSVGAIEDAIGSDDGEPEQELQGDEELELVAGLLEQFMAEADPDAAASEFVAFVESETDADAGEIEGVLNAYLEASDADSLDETPVGALQDFIEDEMGGAEDEGDGEGEEPDEEMEEELAEQRETIRELQERIEDLEDQPVPGDPTAAVGGDDEAEARPGEAMTVQRSGDWLSR